MTATARPSTAAPAIYVDYDGPAFPLLSKWASAWAPLRRFVRRLEVDSSSRRNPRNRDYMRQLAASRGVGPDDIWLDVKDPESIAGLQLPAAERVVLLWRDGNGTGWRRLERAVFARKAAHSRVYVLNGRRREFELTRELWRGYQRRRLLEKSMLAELGIATLLIVASPFLIGWDLVSGKR